MLGDVYDWSTPGMCVSPGDLVHAFEDTFLSLDDGGTFLEIPVIFDAIAAGHPAVHHKRNAPIGGDPFAVVAPGKMQVSGIRDAPLAGGMADVFPGIQIQQ